MRGIVSVIALATIGAGLSTSRGDEKPAARPTSVHGEEISALRQQVERLSAQLEDERKRRLTGRPSGRALPAPADSEKSETFIFTTPERFQSLQNEVRQLQLELKLGELRWQAGPETRPATAPSTIDGEIARRLAELAKKRTELTKNQRLLDGLLKSPTPAIDRTTPDGMPPGSSARQFNGFTYYVVPLGK